jgi:hypothetical protein
VQWLVRKKTSWVGVWICGGTFLLGSSIQCFVHPSVYGQYNFLYSYDLIGYCIVGGGIQLHRK